MRWLMGYRRMMFGFLVLAGFTAGPRATSAQTASPKGPHSPSSFAPFSIPLEAVPGELREVVRAVVEHPTLATAGPVEIFNCQPTMYRWLLDHPDQAVQLWRCLGAKCTEIRDQGDG